ncbi:hypothetical protein MSG28_009956 [Choristoneura fumiferana]|uniref:Uncharacterized protein n=1 Tax=Choristoneura fumiferana TaxID=7141 RepID=A0ACC0JDB1_CHOFU|nr:hypothetical protein MSG28_009956 [Choristoneura fumiferana]
MWECWRIRTLDCMTKWDCGRSHPEPLHRCTVPECESSPPEWDTGEWGSWALGAGRCERRRTLAPGGVCAPATFHENLTQACDAWLYGNQDTIVAEVGSRHFSMKD